MSVADFAEAKKARSGASAPASDLAATMAEIGRNAREAARILAVAPTETKNDALRAMALTLRDRTDLILAANLKDLAAADRRGITGAFRDRLVLDASRIDAMAKGIEDIVALPDPVGAVIADWTRPNGLRIERVRTPLGVVGVIYESRPNVTADAGALTLKAGNAVILRGGSESALSSAAIHDCMVIGLVAAGLPETAIQIVPTTDRAAVGMMLGGLSGSIDVIVPRGGRGLVERVQTEARIPVFAHLEGINHVYVDRAADLAMATDITLNAKMRRTGVCGAAETLLIDRAVVATHLLPIVQALQAAGCAIRGDEETRDHLGEGVEPATEADWSTEYLDAIMSVRVVDGIDEAIDHIERYGSRHTDTIVTEDPAAAAFFLDRVDSAIVLHNASTQFADGAEFGMGAEIGIATGKLHARGPIGVEQLTTFKYRVHGSGQIRP
ncbi:MAG: glutamate-5-semialdehyde dehydrogenase [Bauldia sp.]|nr:glutamate-5-semialdehyde dehydrogenase [Bauldia sp.]